MGKRSICIATGYDRSFRDIGDYAAMSLRFYASRHGHAAFIDDNVTFDRPPAWYRIRLIPALFDRGFDYVMWMDADAVFSRFDHDVADLISPSHDLYMVRHQHPAYSPPLVPNTGMMLARNSGFCRDLFERIWAMDQYLDHPWWENAAMIKLLGFNSLLGEGKDTPADDILARVKFIGDEWNFIPSICAGGDPVIRHFAGFPAEERVVEMPKHALAGCYRMLGEVRSGGGKSLRRLARFLPF